jgi:hypothetical protein
VGPLSPDERLVFAALQGLANRQGARVYLLGLDDTAPTWLPDIVRSPTQSVAPYDLIPIFRADIQGLAVWDPVLAVDTQNVATTMAGLENLLPVSPVLAAKLSAAPYNLPIKENLLGRFSSRAAAYTWALQNLPLNRLTVLAWLGGPRHGIRDWIVAKQGFVFEADPEQDQDIVRQILAAFPYETPVLGYPCLGDPFSQQSGIPICEPIGVGEVSNSGKFFIPTDLAANLTVFSWSKAVQEYPVWDDQPIAPNLPADVGKTYVAFVVSDGDNVGYSEEYMRSHQWADPARGTIPLGFTVSPWLQVMAPEIYDYYAQSLKPDEVLVDAPSGAGYVYPGIDPDLNGYLLQSKPLLQLAGLRTAWILDYGYGTSPSPLTAQAYVEALHPSAIFTDYYGWITPNPPAITFSEGVPVIHALFGGYVPGNAVSSTVEQIRSASASANTQPALVLVALNTWAMGATEAKQVMAQLGPSYVAVRPDIFVGMVKGTVGVNVPPLSVPDVGAPMVLLPLSAVTLIAAGFARRRRSRAIS